MICEYDSVDDENGERPTSENRVSLSSIYTTAWFIFKHKCNGPQKNSASIAFEQCIERRKRLNCGLCNLGTP